MDHMDDEPGRAPLERYLESLRARLPAGQFLLVMRAFHAFPQGAGGAPGQLDHAAHEEELLTPEVQRALLTLLALAAPGFASGGE
jgi:hypothetical protein